MQLLWKLVHDVVEKMKLDSSLGNRNGNEYLRCGKPMCVQGCMCVGFWDVVQFKNDIWIS